MFRCAALFLSLATTVSAAELFSWHSFDIAERLTKKIDIQVTTRLRTRDEFQLLNQVLGGPMLTYRVNSRLLYFGGYWAQPGHEYNKPWLMGHRIFGGVDRRWALKNYTMIGRLTYERHYGAGRPDHNRYRTYTRFMFPRRVVVPFLQYEYMAIRQGFFSSRQTGGVRFHVNPHVMLDVSYQYDVRRASWGGNRNAIITAVSFRRREN
ncbi:MAG: DUF2490 domain-containing protein [Bryobacteraceae bacterium]